MYSMRRLYSYETLLPSVEALWELLDEPHEYKDMATTRALGKLLITNMLKQNDAVKQLFAFWSI